MNSLANNNNDMRSIFVKSKNRVMTKSWSTHFELISSVLIKLTYMFAVEDDSIKHHAYLSFSSLNDEFIT